VWNAALEQRRWLFREYTLIEARAGWTLRYEPSHPRLGERRLRRPDGVTLTSGRSRSPLWRPGLPSGTRVFDANGELVEGQLRQLAEARAVLPELRAVPAAATNAVLYALDAAFAAALHASANGKRVGLPRERVERRVTLTLASFGKTHKLAHAETPGFCWLFLPAARGHPPLGAIKCRSHIALAGPELPPRELKELLWRKRDVSRKYRCRPVTPAGRLGNSDRGGAPSGREQAARRRVARIHARLARIRREQLHLIANDLLDGFRLICIEDIDINKMLRTGNGRAPSWRIALNRRILAQAWGEFARILEYKAPERGADTISVDPRAISCQCPECGCTKRNRPSNSARRFTCTNCGYSADVDHIAARNVLARGLASV
jgi:hypothetical protein